MKKKLIMMILLLMLTGCSAGKNQLAPDETNAESLNNFLNEDNGTLYIGKHFQIRLMPVYRTENRETKFYAYQLLISPVYDEKIHLGKVTVKACQDLDNYRLKGYGMYGALDIILTQGAVDVWDSREKLQALRCDFVFNNMGNKTQTEFGYSDEQFDEMMRTIRIQIKYNLICSETITITAQEPVITVNARQAREIGRDDLYALARFGEYTAFLTHAYAGDFYPAGTVRKTFEQEEIWDKAMNLITEKYPEHSDELYISDFYSFTYYFKTAEGIVARDTGRKGYFLFDGDKLLGLMVKDGNDEYEFFDIGKLGSFVKTMEQNEYFVLLDQADGNCLMIWTPFELITLKTDRDVKEYEEFFNGLFHSADGMDPADRDQLNLYKHRSPLDF